MRIRLPVALILALVLNLVLAGSRTVIQGRPPLLLAECSPPAGLQLPVGQGVGIGCRVHGQATTVAVQFWVNQVLQAATDAGPDEVASWTWVPTRTGRHTVTVVASGSDQATVSVSWRIVVVPSDAPVRVP